MNAAQMMLGEEYIKINNAYYTPICVEVIYDQGAERKLTIELIPDHQKTKEENAMKMHEKHDVEATYKLHKTMKKNVNPYEVRQIIFNKKKNATTVLWADGTATVVKKKEGDPLDEQAAFAQALAKKVYGSTSSVRKIIERKSKDYKGKEAPMSLEEAIRAFEKSFKEIGGE